MTVTGRFLSSWWGGSAHGGTPVSFLVPRQSRPARRALNSTSALAERGAFQRDLGQARTALTAARDRAARLLGRLGDARDADRPLDEEFVDELVSVQTYTTEIAIEVATMTYRYGGPTALRLDNPLQRVLRDLLVAQQHRVIADVSYDALGQVLVGQAG